MSGRRRLMAAHAHPDDESSKGAATMARYAAEGAEVLVCTMTGGERGDVLNPAMDRPEVRADLPRIRRVEMARAREILEVGQRFDPGRYEGDPWRPLKLYYLAAFGKAWFAAIDEAMTAAGMDSPAGEVLKGWDDGARTWEITTRVECAAWFPVRRRALLAHTTQVDPDGPALKCPVELEQKVWPTEDYHLAASRVRAPLPETDLFAGVDL